MHIKVIIYGYTLKRSLCLFNTTFSQQGNPSLLILFSHSVPPLSNDSQIHMPCEAHAVAPAPLAINLIHLIKHSQNSAMVS